MVIGDFDVARVAVVPVETEAVLAVDADTVLPGAVAFEGFEMVAGWDSQFIEADGSGEQAELIGSTVLNLHREFVTFAVPESLSLLIAEALDHT